MEELLEGWLTSIQVISLAPLVPGDTGVSRSCTVTSGLSRDGPDTWGWQESLGFLICKTGSIPVFLVCSPDSRFLDSP